MQLLNVEGTFCNNYVKDVTKSSLPSLSIINNIIHYSLILIISIKISYISNPYC